MLVFFGLCLLSRLAYSLNDVFTGRLARELGRLEVATVRGCSLGLTMSPLLFWVPAAAWSKLGARWPQLLALFALTATANLLQNHAARLLPFGVRAAVMITTTATLTLILGWVVLDEQLEWLQLALAGVLISSAVVAAPGRHATHEIRPDLARGTWFAVAAAAIMAVIMLLVSQLARETDPLLTAWAWEFGSGLVLVPMLAWRYRREPHAGHSARWWRILVGSSPTVVGSGAAMLAMKLGEVGLVAAMGGMQVLFTALLGAWWHRETVGVRRWLCFAVAAGAVFALVRSRG